MSCSSFHDDTTNTMSAIQHPSIICIPTVVPSHDVVSLPLLLRLGYQHRNSSDLRSAFLHDYHLAR